MKHEEAGRYWNENAEVWTQLSRSGYDVYRDYLNTPAFFEILPDVDGLLGLDIGCGEGHNTRLLAKCGAKMTAIDISEVFIRHARGWDASRQDKPLGIDYCVASAVELPLPNEFFDFATGFMSFMDVPETDQVLAEAHRILKPGAFFSFQLNILATPRHIAETCGAGMG